MKHFIIVFSICLGLVFANTGFAEEAPPDFKDSVVKIFVSSSMPDPRAPWQVIMNSRGIGSGAVIEGHRILTSAHVVGYATFIEVKKRGSEKKYRAEIEAIGHDCDLAILKVRDESFFEGVPPLEIGALPDLQDAVLVVGFPWGGDEMSVTEGVVSRIDAVPYSNSLESFMAVQIDAAVNAGNSGGPVFKDNQIVGIAFQTLDEAENIGYMVPKPIIDHFLKDLDDGSYDGFPYVGISWNRTENPSLREYYGMQGHEGGLLLKHVAPEIEEKGLLQVGDVVLSIDGVPVGSDGSVPFEKGSRMPVGYLFDQKQVGEEIDFEVLRDGEKSHVQVPTRKNDIMVKHRNFYEKPPYYIYGGMVFTALNTDLMIALKMMDESDAVVTNLFYYLSGAGRFEGGEKEDVVVLLRVLADEVNVGYHWIELQVVKDVNGKHVSTLEDLVMIIENDPAEWTVVRTEDKDELVINRAKALEAEPRILANYRIPLPYSNDIKKLLEENTKPQRFGAVSEEA